MNLVTREEFFRGYIYNNNYKTFVDGERKKLKNVINSSFYSDPETEN